MWRAESWLLGLALTGCLLLAHPGLAQSCPGDCDRSGHVTIDEIITAINIALAGGSVTSCPSIDADGNGQVTIDEIVAAINRALCGCEGSCLDADAQAFTRALAIVSRASARFRELTATVSATAARQQLIAELLTMPEVSNAQLGQDSETVWYVIDGRTYALLPIVRDGTPSAIVPAGAATDPPQNDGEDGVVTQSPSGPRHYSTGHPGCAAPHSRKALVLSPYDYAHDVDILPDNPTCPQPGISGRRRMSDIVDVLQSTAGYQVDFRRNASVRDQSVTLDDFTRFDRYGAVVINSHGGVAPNGDVTIGTGVIATWSLERDLRQSGLRAPGQSPLIVGADACDSTPRYGVTPAWMQRFYPDRLPATLVAVGGCAGMANRSLSDALIGTGSAYVGFDDTVEYFDSIETLYQVSRWLSVLPASESLANVAEIGRDRFTYQDPPRTWTTRLLHTGSGEMSLRCFDLPTIDVYECAPPFRCAPAGDYWIDWTTDEARFPPVSHYVLVYSCDTADASSCESSFSIGQRVHGSVTRRKGEAGPCFRIEVYRCEVCLPGACCDLVGAPVASSEPVCAVDGLPRTCAACL